MARLKDEQAGAPQAGRRALMRALAALPLAGMGPWAWGGDTLAATPECADDEPTPPQTAGPFFRPQSPLRTSLREAGLAGDPLSLAGRVVTTGCRPVPGALLDFWHTDAGGEYDMAGFRFRGHQMADAAGRFRLETILPGAYSGRPRHIHVRVQAPHGRLLTTQLYFPDDGRNERDGLFSPRLLLQMGSDAAGARQATFTFVLAG